MPAHNAEVRVRGGQVEVLEGDWNPGRTVILKFASFEAARAFYDTPEYQKAKAARAKAPPSCAWCALKAFENTPLLIAAGAYRTSARACFD